MYKIKKSIIILICFIGLIFFISFWLFFHSKGGLRNYLTAKQIPEYPSASFWAIYGRGGFDQPSGVEVCFNTSDNRDIVVNYYFQNFKKRGWRLTDISSYNMTPLGRLRDVKRFTFYTDGRVGTFYEYAGDLSWQYNCDYVIRIGKNYRLPL